MAAEKPEDENDTSIELKQLDDDYLHLDVELGENQIERLNHGSGSTWEFVDDDDAPFDGLYIGAADDTGLGELAFQEHVEENYGPETYRFDLLARSVKTPAFWKQVAVYLVLVVAAPFAVYALGGSAPAGFVVGMWAMIIGRKAVKMMGIPHPMEAAMHE